MMLMSGMGDPAWAERHFGGLDLGDRRRSGRVVKLAGAMAAEPGLRLPELFARWSDLKAAYVLMERPEASPDALQSCHRRKVGEAMSGGGTYLLLADTTDLIYKNREKIEGLGPINDSPHAQGFLLHTTMAVRWPGITPGRTVRPPVEIVGLADQRYEVRKPCPVHEKGRHNSRLWKSRDRESQIWDRGAGAVGSVPPGAQWIDVQDRGADIYEHLRQCHHLGHGHVIRAAQDRRVADPAGEKSHRLLFAAVRRAPSLGGFALAIPSRPGRAGRQASMCVSAIPVRVIAPQRPGHRAGTLPPVDCSAVRVYEAAPPQDGDAVEWILLCSGSVGTFEQALECALMYSARWIIEEFHKALKTGLGAERLQLETANRLFAAIAIMSVVAAGLVQVREQARLDPLAPPESLLLGPLELEMLRAKTGRPILTAAQAALALGKLGGHIGRKSDGMPGWLTLWRGHKKLRLLIEGASISARITGFG